MRSPGSVSGVNSSGSSAHFSGPLPWPETVPEPPQPASRAAAASATSGAERLAHGRLGSAGTEPPELPPEPGSAAAAPAGCRAVGAGRVVRRLGRAGEPVAAGRVGVLVRIPGRARGLAGQLGLVARPLAVRARAGRQADQHVAGRQQAGVARVAAPAVALALLVPPDVVAVGVRSAVGPHAELVVGERVVEGRVHALVVLAAERRRHVEQLDAVAPVVVDVVVAGDVAVAAEDANAGADRDLEGRAHDRRVALLDRRVLAVRVALVVEVVLVVGVDLVVLPLRAVLRHARVPATRRSRSSCPSSCGAACCRASTRRCRPCPSSRSCCGGS